MNVLVLNASYEALNVTRWQRAVCLLMSGKAELLETNGNLLHSANSSMELPSVIRMVYFVNKPRIAVPFSRANVLMRDHHTCQYCGAVGSPGELTLDHVSPRSWGGETCWENIVAACKKCNSKKGNRTPEAAGMKLSRRPRAPQFTPSIMSNARADWEKYIAYAIPARRSEAS